MRRRKRGVQGDRSSLSLWVLCILGNTWQQTILVNKVTIFLPATLQLSSILRAPTHRHTQRLSRTFGSMRGAHSGPRGRPCSGNHGHPSGEEQGAPSVHLFLILFHSPLSLQGAAKE